MASSTRTAAAAIRSEEEKDDMEINFREKRDHMGEG